MNRRILLNALAGCTAACLGLSTLAHARPGDRGEPIRVPSAPFIHASSTKMRTATVSQSYDCTMRFTETAPRVEYSIAAATPGVLSVFVDGEGTPASVGVTLVKGLDDRTDGMVTGCLAHGNKQASASVEAGTQTIIISTPNLSDGGTYRLRIDLQPADDWYARPIARGVTLKTRTYRNLFGAKESGAVLEVNLADPNVLVKPMAHPGSCTLSSRLGKDAGAVAAINGGFFDTSNCASVSLLKIDDNLLARNAVGRTAFGIDRMKRPLMDLVAAGQDWPEASQAIGGLPRIATGGRVDLHTVAEGSNLQFEQGRNPRTAVGITQRGTLILAVVNGRTGASAGMSLQELATWMIGLGAQDAVNLDGGGSSVLWVAGEPGNGIVSHPSDSGGERRVSSALGVFARRLDRPARWLTRPAPASVRVGDEWSFEAVVADPEARAISFRVDQTRVDGQISVRDRGDGTARFAFVPSLRDADHSPLTLTLYADVRASSTATVGATITVIPPPPPPDSGVFPDSGSGVGADGSIGPGPGGDAGSSGGPGTQPGGDQSKSGCACSAAPGREGRAGAGVPGIALALVSLFGVALLGRGRRGRRPHRPRNARC